MTKSLTTKQSVFVDEYLIDLNATQAAIRAGYSKKTAMEQGYQLLQKTSVQEAVKNAMASRSERTGIDADYVLYTIQETVERCKQAKPVTYKNGDPVFTETPNGDLVPAYSFESASVLRGCELLGKHLKLFTDKVEHSGNVSLEDMTADERARRIHALQHKYEQSMRD